MTVNWDVGEMELPKEEIMHKKHLYTAFLDAKLGHAFEEWKPRNEEKQLKRVQH